MSAELLVPPPGGCIRGNGTASAWNNPGISFGFACGLVLGMVGGRQSLSRAWISLISWCCRHAITV